MMLDITEGDYHRMVDEADTLRGQLHQLRLDHADLRKTCDAKQEVLWDMRRAAEMLGIPDGSPEEDGAFVLRSLRALLAAHETNRVEFTRVAAVAKSRADELAALKTSGSCAGCGAATGLCDRCGEAP